MDGEGRGNEERERERARERVQGGSVSQFLVPLKTHFGAGYLCLKKGALWDHRPDKRKMIQIITF